jgi:stage II sporulation protein D
MTLKQKLAIMLIVFFMQVGWVYSFESLAKEDLKVRIGLIHRHNVQDVFRVDSPNGLIFSTIKEGALDGGAENQMIWTHPSKETLIVLKDRPYEIENSGIKVMRDIEQSAGNYYIKLGEEVLETGDPSLKEEYAQKGLMVFLWYDQSFHWVTGPYFDLDAALAGAHEIKNILPDTPLTVIEPHSQRLLLLNQEKEPVFLFSEIGNELFIKPAEDAYLRFEENRERIYRGNFSTYRLSNGNLILVNILPIEEYLYGVVPYEIGASSPLEAIKAQAVAARNYTYNSMGKYASEKFDLCDTVYSQVYRGMFRESPNSNQGVDETRGELLKYQGKNAQVFYFSSTGGVETENVEHVWGSKIPYLVSVKSEYETPNTHLFSWTLEKSNQELQDLLSRRSILVGQVMDLNVLKRSSAGRVIELEIVGSKGRQVIARETSRTTFQLPSQYYEIKMDTYVLLKSAKTTKSVPVGGVSLLSAKGMTKVKDRLVISNGTQTKSMSIYPETVSFIGRGWGHAVGMSQNGAIGMAKAGFSYDKILMHYFPGTVLE